MRPQFRSQGKPFNSQICCILRLNKQTDNNYNFNFFSINKSQMGPNSSKAHHNVELSLNHPKFQAAKRITNQNEKYMETTMGIDQKQYDLWKSKLDKFQGSSEFILLPKKQRFSPHGLCGTSGSVTIQYPNFPYLLTEEIYNRKGNKKIFQEHEIWHLLLALSSAQQNMVPPSSKVGDIRPHNIFINERAALKVSSTLSWPLQKTNYAKSFEHVPTYLSPQELKNLQVGYIQKEADNHSQMFSIGLTLMSCIALEDFTHYYDFKAYTFNEAKLKEKVKDFEANIAYSEILKATVRSLLEKEENRITSKELWNWIQPHEIEIRQRQNFTFPGAPRKIQFQVKELRGFLKSFLPPKSHNLKQNPQKLETVVKPEEQEYMKSGQKYSQIARTSVPESSAKDFSSPDKKASDGTFYYNKESNQKVESTYTPMNNANQVSSPGPSFIKVGNGSFETPRNSISQNRPSSNNPVNTANTVNFIHPIQRSNEIKFNITKNENFSNAANNFGPSTAIGNPSNTANFVSPTNLNNPNNPNPTSPSFHTTVTFVHPANNMTYIPPPITSANTNKQANFVNQTDSTPQNRVNAQNPINRIDSITLVNQLDSFTRPNENNGYKTPMSSVNRIDSIKSTDYQIKESSSKPANRANSTNETDLVNAKLESQINSNEKAEKVNDETAAFSYIPTTQANFSKTNQTYQESSLSKKKEEDPVSAQKSSEKQFKQ